MRFLTFFLRALLVFIRLKDLARQVLVLLKKYFLFLTILNIMSFETYNWNSIKAKQPEITLLEKEVWISEVVEGLKRYFLIMENLLNIQVSFLF